MTQEYTNFTCEVHHELLHVIFNSQGSSVNTLSAMALQELDTIISSVMIGEQIKGVVFESAKPNCFIAGADINEIAKISDEQDAYAKASVGQEVINKIAKLRVPTYAIINGACMGGGLELALACDIRIATNHEKTKFALPEVNLGFIPGFGGTQRLPRTVGLKNALDLILKAKAIDSKKAKKINLVHDVCHLSQARNVLLSIHSNVVETGGKWIEEHRYKSSILKRLFSSVVLFVARRNVMKVTKGQYPAALKAIEVIKKTRSMNMRKGLELEAKAFGALASSDVSRNLVTLFFTNEALKKEYCDDANTVDQALILGSGVMGGGIAFALNRAGVPVRMKDISVNALALGYKQIKDYYKPLVKRRKLSRKQADINLTQITSSTDFTGIAHTDLVIEAVVEDISIKHKVLQEIETKLKEDCIIATNTSSLKVADIAQPLARKENVVGMHFFNPVNKMPLVEVVKTKHSSPQAIATVMQLARKCGKVAIPVGDCNGFVVNRILLPFMNEALLCLEESGAVVQIDQALKDFGMPMGAFELADEIGLDVCYKVSKILYTAYGERMKPAQLLEKMFKHLKLLGKKGGEGFYKKKKPSSHIEVSQSKIDSKKVVDRSLLIMVNEAARILEEGYIKNPHYLDMCMIMGAGFPAFRGGILKYADSLGIENVHSLLAEFSQKYGDRFTPCKIIRHLAKEKKKFYEVYKI